LKPTSFNDVNERLFNEFFSQLKDLTVDLVLAGGLYLIHTKVYCTCRFTVHTCSYVH